MQNYSSWQNQFLYERLKFGRLFAIGAVMGHLALDIVVHPDHLIELLVARLFAVGALSLTWLLDRTQYGRENAHVTLALIVMSINVPLIYTTVLLGGFSSSYYLGIVSVTIGAAALFPSRWKVHFTTQMVTLMLYCLANFLLVSPIDYIQAYENIVVLSVVFGLSDLSIFFYQQQHEEAYQLAKGLEDAHEKLVRKEASKTSYFLRVRHRLMKPIQDVIDEETDGNPDREERKTAMIEVRSILRDLIEKSYIESGSFKPKFTNFSLVDIAHDLEEVYGEWCKFKFGSQVGVIRSDSRRVRQIIENIILFLKNHDTNPITVQIERVKKDSGNWIEISITQAGVGLAPEQRAAIFIPYHISEGSISGLGLPLAREIARELGGDVHVMGELGRETRFKFEIPCDQATTDLWPANKQ